VAEHEGWRPGQRFGRFVLTGRIGRGGMGEVFAAELTGLAGFRKRVALKVLHRDAAALSDGWRERFVREARLAALLQHPNVVDVYELGEHEGTLYIAMELVPGPTLRDLGRSLRVLPPRAVVEVLGQVAVGLAHAHALRVDGRLARLVHRDLKPSNLLVHPAGVVKIADFGVATAASVEGLADRSDTVCGTLPYMAPEQARGAAPDPRSDLWALGMIAVALSIGEHPWRFKDVPSFVRGIPDLAARLEPAVSRCERAVPGLGDVVRACLAPELGDRPGAAVEVVAALRAIAVDGPGLSALLPSEGKAAFGARTTASVDRAPAPALVGRGELGETLSRYLVAAPAVVTLRGPGGVGKTALARHAVAGLAAGELAWFDLTTCASAEDLVRRVAAGLGFAEPDRAALDAQVGRALRFSSRVLVFDGAEGVVDALRDALGRWGVAGGNHRVWVTARQSLGTGEERVLQVPPLDADHGVQLLRLRAAAQPGRLRGWSEDEASLREICARLDGLPVAIELAAARAAELEPRALLDRLDHRFRLLTRSSDARSGSLWAVIDTSWALLSDVERDALTQLSVFAGPFDLDSADAIVDLSEHDGAPWTIDVLHALHARSLIHVVDPESGRLTLLESVRAFARLRASEREGHPDVAARHARWCEQYYRDGGEDRAYGSLAGVTLRDMEAALGFLLGRGEVEGAARVALGIAAAVLRAGPLEAGLEPLARVLGVLPAGPLAREAQGRRAWIHHLLGQRDEAKVWAKAQLTGARQVGDPAQESKALNLLGLVLRDRGDHDGALTLFGASIRAARRAGSPALQLSARNNQAGLYLRLGDLDEAEVVIAQNLELASSLGDHHARSRATTWAHLASLALARGRVVDALSHARTALAGYADCGDVVRSCAARITIAQASAEIGDGPAARVALLEAVNESRAAGLGRHLVIASINLANLERVGGARDRAAQRLRGAEDDAAACGDAALRATATANLGDLLLTEGRIAEAIDVLKRATVGVSPVDPLLMAFCAGALAEAFARQGEADGSESALQEARASLGGSPPAAEALRLELRAVRCAWWLGQADEARRRLDALQVSRSASNVPSCTTVGWLTSDTLALVIGAD
jgi:predicted ATPase/tRNA A-37 threonylcarbamoyl transferase component Bud32